MKLQLVLVRPFDAEISLKRIAAELRSKADVSVKEKEISPSLGSENGWWISDDAFFGIPGMRSGLEDDEICVLVTSHRLENNWFVRRNDMDEFSGNPKRTPPIVVVSTKDLMNIMYGLPISFERVVAAIVLNAIYTSDFLKRGANYRDIYTDAIENCVFNFCVDKEVIRNSLNAGTIGTRIKQLMENLGYSPTEIRRCEDSFRAITRDRITQMEYFGRNHPVLLSIVIFLIGWVISGLFSPMDLFSLLPK